MDVEVEIASTDEMIERLLAGRVQLALVGETEVDDRVELTPFLADEIVGIAKPGCFRSRADGSRRALAEQTLLVREAGSSTRQTAERARPRGVRPERVWELDSSEAIKRAARKGSASPSSRAMRSPRRSSAASSQASASKGQPKIERASTSRGSPAAL